MKTFRRKLPALTLAIALMGLALPALPGGRDVPDRHSSDLVGPERPDRKAPEPGDSSCGDSVKLASVTVGGLPFEMSWSAEDGYRVLPWLWSAAASLLDQATGGDGCPTG